MDVRKKCPDGQIRNPMTGRCVKIDGRIGRKLVPQPEKKCPIGQILNKETGRCVKIDGKIGRKLIGQSIIIVFKPTVSLLCNSSFDTGRSKSPIKRKHVWDNEVDILSYLKWYKSFDTQISNVLKKHNILFISFDVFDKEHLLLKLKSPDIQKNHFKQIQKSVNENDKLDPIGKAIKFALSPDVNEDNIISLHNQIHIVESSGIKTILLRSEENKK